MLKEHTSLNVLEQYLRGDKKLKDGRTYWRLQCGHIRMTDITKCHRDKNDNINAYCKVCHTIQPIAAKADRWDEGD